MVNSSAMASEIGNTVEDPSTCTAPDSAAVSGVPGVAGSAVFEVQPASAPTARIMTMESIKNLDFNILCFSPFEF
jgi:hypothetical protein